MVFYDDTFGTERRGSMEKGGYLSGKLLIATPAMGDPRFDHAVIYLCAHDENGAMGLVINHVMPDIGFKDLVGQLKIQSDIKIDLGALNLRVMSGGPVETARGFLLHSHEFAHADTLRVDNMVGITGTVEALRDVVRGQGPEKMMFVLGYAGWGEGQLEAELQDNAWLVVDCDADLLFNAPPEDKWKRAVGKLGFDPSMLSITSGRA